MKFFQWKKRRAQNGAGRAPNWSRVVNDATLREEGSLSEWATVSLGWLRFCGSMGGKPKGAKMKHHAAETAAEIWVKWNDPPARF